jgi:hypothetical protein
MRQPTTPGRQEQIRASRALRSFELRRKRLDELERGGFVHGWQAGDRGMPLVDLLTEFDRGHPQAAKVILAAAYGHCGGYAAFLREEPDYDELESRIRNGEIDALLEDPSRSVEGQDLGRRLLASLVSFFEQHG